MQLILGNPIAKNILESVGRRLRLAKADPGLAVIMIGDDPASKIYVGLKEKAAHVVGMRFEKYLLPVESPMKAVLQLINELNERSDIHGIIVQLPLPVTLDPDTVISAVRKDKDADGFHPDTIAKYVSTGTGAPPVFPRAILALLASTGLSLSGMRACIFANSALFARVVSTALGQIGVQADSSPTLDNRTFEERLSLADIIISARGEPGFLKRSMVGPGAIIIDGGITRVWERVVGDVDLESFGDFKGRIAPVPGGVGPVTVALLIARTAELALREDFDESIL